MVPAEGGLKIFGLKSSSKQNFGCQPQTLEGEEGGRGGSRGGYTPPPPTVYGRSNTSLGGGGGDLITLQPLLKMRGSQLNAAYNCSQY